MKNVYNAKKMPISILKISAFAKMVSLWIAAVLVSNVEIHALHAPVWINV